MKKILILLLFPFLVIGQTNKEIVSNEKILTIFYNVENLFDTINNPDTNDDEFIPTSEKNGIQKDITIK